MCLFWQNCLLSYDHPIRDNGIIEPSKHGRLFRRFMARCDGWPLSEQNLQFPDIFPPIYPSQIIFMPTIHKILPALLIGKVLYRVTAHLDS